jgi:Xaa-Pro aminopeptidase
MTILTQWEPVNWTTLRPEGRAGDTYGELGIGHEDTVVVTENGCESICPKWSG